jgi:curved DNA-binding protein CbpA
MATAGVLSIKLRCASWQQLATVYHRDLSKGTMFLKAVQPPAIGTAIRIDLTLPSASVIELTGVVDHHVTDQRGAGVELRLAPIADGSIWLIESALASGQRRSTPARGVTAVAPAPPPVASMGDGADVATAETDLVRALHAEVESLKKLNPFLVLGLGYEAGDGDVRKAFGELTKRYHPDRFARYESSELRHVAAEIFILIRDAYRRLCDEDGRTQALSALGRSRNPVPIPRVPPPPRTDANPPPTVQLPAPPPRAASVPPLPPPRAAPAAGPEPLEILALEDLIDARRLDEALAGYKGLTRRYPQDRTLRAGIELCEGLLAMGLRDRGQAAQRFETALEIDPSNERAARELADMRRQATHERKGLLSRLMSKPEAKER